LGHFICTTGDSDQHVYTPVSIFVLLHCRAVYEAPPNEPLNIDVDKRLVVFM